MLDLDIRALSLTFNDTMNVSSLDVTEITIQDAETAVISYALQDSISASPNGTTVVINLSMNDFNTIAGTPHLAKSLDTSWLTFTSDAIQNINGTNVNPIVNGSALQASTYAADASAPTLPFVHIYSNEVDPSQAKVDDNITIQYTASEPLNVSSASVLIAGNVADIVGDSLYWNASYQMQQSDLEGVVTFAIHFSDTANNPGANVTSATDGSNVTFDKSPPTSSVDVIIPYWRNTLITVIALADDGSGVGVNTITLYYSFSADNVSFGGWVTNGTQDRLPGNWTFLFDNGTGYYRFMSIASDLLGNTESKGSFDTMCGFETSTPTSQIDAITSAWQTSPPLTITATASNGLSGVKNVTLYYRFCDDNTSWETTWVRVDVDAISPWSWAFMFPNGSGYYQFFSVACDNATNEESAPGSADAWCRYDLTAPDSAVDAITPYWLNAATTITATANDTTSGVKNVTLYYRFSSDNASWGTWVNAGDDSTSPWSWSFSFVNGSGYYQFNSIALDNATNPESVPGSPDTLCGYDTEAPTSSVDSITPYWNTAGLLTITVSASDGFSGIKNVTLYSRYSTNNISWDGWVNVGIDTSSPWSWSFTFPNGTKYYQFTSTANDNMTNTKPGPGVAEASCGFDLVAPPSGFTATPVSTTMINLAWTKGTNTSSTRIQRKTGGYPHNISDGTNIYNGSNASCVDSGLSPGTVYYYRAWSFNGTGSLWSTINASASATTQDPGGPGSGPGPGPIDASLPVSRPGGPYHGVVNTPIVFNGSASYDADSSIVRYDWRFATGDAWHNNTGATPTHTYPAAGTYSVTLIVYDSGGNAGTGTTTATITMTYVNQPPTQPMITGPITGGINTPYTFSIVATDPNNDRIQYNISWGDGTTDTSPLLASGTVYSVVHTWTTSNVYAIGFYAEDENQATSDITSVTIAINATPMQRYGYVLDINGDGSPDSFYHNSTRMTTTMLPHGDGSYLLDLDGDSTWDHVYDSVTRTIAPYAPVLVTPPNQVNLPWVFLVIMVIALFVIACIVWLFKTGRI